MRRLGLYGKFAILFGIVAAALLAVNAVWSISSQWDQAEREMLEKAQMLAEEMNSVWEFMETNQNQFKLDEDGNYTMYCVVAAKSISLLFTINTDYTIHYTNAAVRKARDAPDAFEIEALKALESDKGAKEYYALEADAAGNTVFRYVQPLFITESCLECHGGPAGELDQLGYPKEGKKIGDIAGVSSIIMPTETYFDNMSSIVVQNTLVFCLVLVSGLSIIFLGVSRMVTKPVKMLGLAAQHIEAQNFDVNLDDVGHHDEIEDLAARFRSMACQLQKLYSGLEEEVEQRTAQLKTLNEMLESTNQRLETANDVLLRNSQYKSDFLAMMSHELKTPLTSILAFTDIWEKTYTPRDCNEEKITREVGQNSRILLRIVNNILEMARIEAGKTELDLAPVDLVDVIREVKESTSGLAEKKGIQILVHVAADVPVLGADPEKMRSILENLVSNAIKFSAQGGYVQISACYQAEEGAVALVVRDEGSGIAKDDLPFIFDRFSQGKDRERSWQGGSGLGLSVVKELVELHGGHVEVQSSLGKGSVFEVRLPIRSTSGRELQ